jgi:hypothetical protein
VLRGAGHNTRMHHIFAPGLARDSHNAGAKDEAQALTAEHGVDWCGPLPSPTRRRPAAAPTRSCAHPAGGSAAAGPGLGAGAERSRPARTADACAPGACRYQLGLPSGAPLGFNLPISTEYWCPIPPSARPSLPSAPPSLLSLSLCPRPWCDSVCFIMLHLRGGG